MPDIQSITTLISGYSKHKKYLFSELLKKNGLNEIWWRKINQSFLLLLLITHSTFNKVHNLVNEHN